MVVFGIVACSAEIRGMLKLGTKDSDSLFLLFGLAEMIETRCWCGKEIQNAQARGDNMDSSLNALISLDLLAC